MSDDSPRFLKAGVLDQATDHLREGIRSGRYRGVLPGVRVLAEELGLAKSSIAKVITQLEREKLLAPAVAGKSRLILEPAYEVAAPMFRGVRRALRLGVLLPQPLEACDAVVLALIGHLTGQLYHAGHTVNCRTPPSGMSRHKTGRLARLVSETPADAWIIYRGTVAQLEWFA